MYQKREVLAKIAADYATIVNDSATSTENKIQIDQELSIVKRLYEEEAWHYLSEEKKQKSRIASLALLDKWSSEEGDTSDSFLYEKSLIKLYDSISISLNNDWPDAPIFTRLKSILLIEKFFIDEKKELNALRHMDYYLWSNLFQQTKKSHTDMYKQLKLEDTNNYFMSMYINWEKRPYKQI